ncbi:dihydrolipoyl dehydrogenase [Candidatus Woesearchaeota archaeon]|nr:dihydrolipoyl dehydrogenase [Candidatus Woesearchaeota archaeon]
MPKAMKTDVAVVGGGPGGYVAAIRLAQLNKKVILIDKDKLGGTCLNYGCIPSKALISASGFFDKIKKSSVMGITVGKVELNFEKMQQWKDGIVSRLNSGIEFLCKKNNVTVVKGTAFFESSNRVRIANGEDVAYIDFEKAVIASGSKPVELQNLKFDGKKIISSKEALSLTKIPESLVIVGGGYIGLELGTLYAKLGSRVYVVEMMEQILPGFDKGIADMLQKNLEKLNIKIYTNAKAEKLENNKVVINSKEEGKISVDAEKILVAVGRKPNTSGIGLEKTGVASDTKGFVKVDKRLMTTDENIYAIGDVSTGPMLAHKASMQGKFVAEAIAGKKAEYEAVVPAVIFTDPEIAVAGLTEEEAKKAKIKARTGRFPFSASGRAMTKNETQGFVKLIADDQNRIIGAQIVGEEVSELIGEAVLVIKMKAKLEDLASAIHPHPTLSESLMEAAEAAIGKAIHILNSKL